MQNNTGEMFRFGWNPVTESLQDNCTDSTFKSVSITSGLMFLPFTWFKTPEYELDSLIGWIVGHRTQVEAAEAAHSTDHRALSYPMFANLGGADDKEKFDCLASFLEQATEDELIPLINSSSDGSWDMEYHSIFIEAITKHWYRLYTEEYGDDGVNGNAFHCALSGLKELTRPVVDEHNRTDPEDLVAHYISQLSMAAEIASSVPTINTMMDTLFNQDAMNVLGPDGKDSFLGLLLGEILRNPRRSSLACGSFIAMLNTTTKFVEEHLDVLTDVLSGMKEIIDDSPHLHTELFTYLPIILTDISQAGGKGKATIRLGSGLRKNWWVYMTERRIRKMRMRKLHGMTKLIGRDARGRKLGLSRAVALRTKQHKLRVADRLRHRSSGARPQIRCDCEMGEASEEGRQTEVSTDVVVPFFVHA